LCQAYPAREADRRSEVWTPPLCVRTSRMAIRAIRTAKIADAVDEEQGTSPKRPQKHAGNRWPEQGCTIVGCSIQGYGIK